MYNFGKAGFDPGHHAGANAGPGSYREGDVMLRLGLMLRSEYDVFLTRTDGDSITLLKRARLAADAGVDTLISLHTNAPQAAAGVIVFYSVRHPEDKKLAEYIGSEIAQAIGLKFRGAATRPSASNPQVDYYGIIRNPVQMGIDHSFIVEHGSHWEMAVNTDDKLTRIVEAYGRILQLVKAETSNGTVGGTTGGTGGAAPGGTAGAAPGGTAGAAPGGTAGGKGEGTTNDDSSNTATNNREILAYVEILNNAMPQIIGDQQKWLEKAAADKDIYWLLRKAADYVQKHSN